jgi:hypothetical protein
MIRFRQVILAAALQTDEASLLSRDPADGDGLWSVWEQARPRDRRLIVDIAKAVTKRNSDDERT